MPESIEAKPTPVFVDDQTGGKPVEGPKVEHDEHKPQSAAERIAALAAKIGKPAAPAAPTAKIADKPATGVTDDAIKAAEAKAAELAAVKAAVVDPATDDFGKRVAEAAKIAGTDPIKAMELLGINLNDAIKKAQEADTKPGDSTEDKLRAENEQLKKAASDRAESDKQAEAQRAIATRQAETVSAIIADKDFPGITSAELVEKAFAEARSVHKTLVADLGRPLNETEADNLVRRYLKKHSDAATGAQGTDTTGQPSASRSKPDAAIRTGVVQSARRPAKLAEVRARILSKR